MGEGKQQEEGRRTQGTGRRKHDEVGTVSGYRNEGHDKEGQEGVDRKEEAGRSGQDLRNKKWVQR
jgi:hypothetical protein